MGNTALNWIALFCLLMIVCTIAAVSVVPAPPRSPVPTPVPPYPICTSYSSFGKPCIWQGGIEIPMLTRTTPRYGTMVTLVLPYANPGWQLYRSDFNFTVDMVYLGACKNSITYWNDASLYLNNGVCR